MENMYSDKETGIIANEPIDPAKAKIAGEIIKDLQNDIPHFVSEGCGPFVAALYTSDGKLITKEANSVKNDRCSHNHAEMNVIKKAEKLYQTHDLSQYNFNLYITSEPCIMCLGGIMWSGIKNIFYGVPSEKVEEITGFDEGFKPNWLNEFKQRGITVYGNIEADLGISMLQKYVNEGNDIYKPSR